MGQNLWSLLTHRLMKKVGLNIKNGGKATGEGSLVVPAGICFAKYMGINTKQPHFILI